MKKWICLLGMMACFLVCTISVRADVIWTPQNNFIEKHREDLKVVSREYTANGPDGVVILYESPESNTEVATWENGYQTWIIYTYEDKRGIVWGYPSASSAMSGETFAYSGWMPMEYMELVYDSISFWEEHGEEIESKDGVLDESYKDDTIYFWEYPGSDNSDSINMQDRGSSDDKEIDMPNYSYVYIDEEGRSWGYTYFIHFYNIDNGAWICLDNPTAEYEELYPNGAPQSEVKDNEENQLSENRNTERITPKSNHSTIVVVIALVAAVVLITIVLLVILKKRK